MRVDEISNNLATLINSILEANFSQMADTGSFAKKPEFPCQHTL